VLCTTTPSSPHRSGYATTPVWHWRKDIVSTRLIAAELAATIWTVTSTIAMAGLNVLTWLTAYLDAYGRNGGKPLSGTDLERFLPWNASPEDLQAWAQSPPQPG
jgi:hypothetical protein